MWLSIILVQTPLQGSGATRGAYTWQLHGPHRREMQARLDSADAVLDVVRFCAPQTEFFERRKLLGQDIL